MHVALIAVLTWVMGWPDVILAARFISGFTLTGRMERTGIFDAVDAPEPRSVEDLFAQSERWVAVLGRDRPSPGAQFLCDSCLEEKVRLGRRHRRQNGNG